MSVLVVWGSFILYIYLFSSLSTYKSLGASLDAYMFLFFKITNLFNVNAKIFSMGILVFHKLNWRSFWRQLIVCNSDIGAL